MISGSGWRAWYAVHGTGDAWDLTYNTQVDVVCWAASTDASTSPPHIVGWVNSPSGSGPAATQLVQAGSVSITGADGRVQSFMRYVRAT